ncbi:TPA: hypothetical protein N0F65_008175 [Lagenidium giganteum]|uniref:DUF2428 domain-containing protein n=1 Tax=Lagenidium giganteum TaxID=4803 RepID=A0AAV2YNH2_9STRA|nr:TPA: hypothetical protein N0F65_008175 [Lagenidium giganteum]
MVRKKRKGIVKECEASDSAAPRAVMLKSVLEAVPCNASVTVDKETLELAQWFDQASAAATLFEQLKHLQLFRSKCKLLMTAQREQNKPEDVEAFVVAAWRLVWRLFVANSVNGVRKNMFLILEALALHAPVDSELERALQVAAKEELEGFLDHWAASAPATDADAAVVHMDLLLQVVDFPYVAGVFVDCGYARVNRVLNALARSLELLAQPISEFQAARSAQRESTLPTNAVLVASERCGHATKVVILVCAMKDTIYSWLRGLSSEEFAPVTTSFFQMLSTCVVILQTDVVHKDLLTQAGLAYCYLVRLLLHTVEPANIVTVPATTWLLGALFDGAVEERKHSHARLQHHLQGDVRSFGELSRLAIFRGFLNSLSDDELAAPCTLPHQDYTAISVMDAVFADAANFCQAQALNTRVYAFQVLEAFLRRAVNIVQRASKTTASGEPVVCKAVSLRSLSALTTVILLNWEYPSKKVNQFMGPMFMHIVNYFIATREFDSWKNDIVVKLMDLPQPSRGKYAALSILLKDYGARQLIEAHPSVLETILLAVGHKDVSAAAAGLFALILDDLNDAFADKNASESEIAAKLAAWRALWIDDVVRALLCDDANLRSRVAMFAMPLLLKKDPGCVPVLIEKLRAAAAQASVEVADIALWATIEAIKFARKHVTPEKLEGVSMADIEMGLTHSSSETRCAAFDALCASLKSTNMPTPQELCLVKRYLVMSSKEIPQPARMNTMVGLRSIFFRVKESARINSKPSKIGPTDVQIKELKRAKDFQRWVEAFVVGAVYSGSPPQRTISGLEVMLLYIQVFGLETDSDEASLLMTPHMATILLNMLVSAWDVIRSLAFTILETYPRDNLPGYTTETELAGLLKWSMALCISPRQRESDAGALFMRLLYQRSELMYQVGVSIIEDENVVAESRTTDVRFILSLCAVITQRLTSVDARKGEAPLVHGLLLSLRYILEHTEFDRIARSDKALEWKAVMDRVFTCIWQSMQQSLCVVGDATAGLGDEELSQNYAVVGEVSANQQSGALPLRVDCRGHLILDDADADADGDDADAEQRAVVGSWLAARECGAILDTLMKRVPLPSDKDTSTLDLFSIATAERAGETLLNSLFELKHKGAIATAYQAFEGICKSFLAHGERNAHIGSLPAKWADRLLDRLERSEQHFILRRSSGFAFSFVAILRAEPRNSAAIILPKVMNTLLRLASQDTDEVQAENAHSQHLLWRSRVHALNILKLISQDAVLADDVAIYISRMLELAVFGFECHSWAVRNSAMMLFAAATQRAMGDKRVADSASKFKASSIDVFSRFHNLSNFLFAELSKYTSPEQENGVTPPGLYPILMFLSRMKPGDDAHTAEEYNATATSKSLGDFIPLVEKCASRPVFAIRHIAGKVLATITRPVEALPLLEKLHAKLPNGVASKTPSVAGRPKITTNFVHGVLIQILCIVESYLDTRESSEEIMKIADLIVEWLASTFIPSRMWLWDDEKLASKALRAVFLQTVDAFVRYISVRQMRQRLQCSQLEQVDIVVAKIHASCARDLDRLTKATASSLSALTQVPGAYMVNRALVSIFFESIKASCASASNRRLLDADTYQLIFALLESRVLELRKRSIKQLANALVRSKDPLPWSFKEAENLRTVLLRQYPVETHPKVQARQLQLLLHCQREVESPLPSEYTPQLLSKLSELFDVCQDSDRVASGLELLGLLTKMSEYKHELPRLVEQIVQRSSEKQALVLRQGAAQALHLSNLLVCKENETPTDANMRMQSWLSAIKLLQDDDSKTRALVGVAVHDALELAHQPNLPRHPSDTFLLPLAVKHLVDSTANYSAIQEVLLRELKNDMSALSLLNEFLSGAKSQDWGDLCNRIFEAESSNYYAESDLEAQAYVEHLVPVLPPITQIQILEELLEALRILQQNDALQEHWLGGVMYYSTVFSTLYDLVAAGVSVVTSDNTTAIQATSPSILENLAQEASKVLTQLHPSINGEQNGDDDDGDAMPSLGWKWESNLLEKDDMGCLPVHVALIYQRKECFSHVMQYSAALTTAMLRSKCADLNTPFMHLVLRVGAINPAFATEVVDELCGTASEQTYSEDVLAQVLERLGVRDEEGNTVFHLCAMYDLDVCFDILVAFYQHMLANDKEDPRGETGLRALLERPNRIGLRPLHAALKFESVSIATKLVDTFKVDVNAVTSLQHTALHVAALAGFEEGIQLLLKSDKADLKGTDKLGYTAADVARKCKFDGVVRLLTGNKANGKAATSGKEKSDTVKPTKSCFLYHPDALRHLPMAYHRRGGTEPPPENPERIDTLVDPIIGILRSREFQKEHIEWDHEIDRADIADILRVHEYHYVDKIRRYCDKLAPTPQASPVHKSSSSDMDEDDDPEEKGKTYVLDPDTALSLRSYDAASRAAGAVCKAVDHVVNGTYANAFCIVRPPGHHAGPVGKVVCENDPEGSHGFCLFNNVAIGAAYARSHYKNAGIQRIAILDFDVHHGNGTEEIVRKLVPGQEMVRYETPYGAGYQVVHTYKPWRSESDAENVFFCSVHGYGHKDPEKEHPPEVQQAWFYPGSGETERTKDAPFIWNVGMEFCKEGSSVSRLKWRSAFRDQVLMTLTVFNPDLIFLSAGFDAHRKEQVNWNYMALLEQDYEWLLHHVKRVANKCCNGRLISVLEGGYNFHGRMVSPFARSVAAHARALVHQSGEEWNDSDVLKEAQHERDLLENYLAPPAPSGTLELKKKRVAPASPTAKTEDDTNENANDAETTQPPIAVTRSKRARKQVDYVALAKELDKQSVPNLTKS